MQVRSWFRGSLYKVACRALKWIPRRRLIPALVLALASVAMISPSLVIAKDGEVAELKASGRKNPRIKSTAKGSKILNKAYDLHSEEKFDEALAELDKLLGGRASPYEQSKAHQIKANLYYEKDDMAAAVAEAKAALDTNGLDNKEHLDVMLTYAQLLYANEQFDDAIKAYEAYIADAPQVKGEAYASLAACHYEKEDWASAVQMVDKALATGDKPQNNWLQIKINALYQSENYEAAIAFLKELLAKDPGNAQYNNMLVSSYLQTEKNQEALDHLLAMKSAGKFDSELLWKQLYQLYQSEDKWVESTAIIEEAVAAGGLKATSELYVDLGEAWFAAADGLAEKETAKRAEYMGKALAAFEKAAASATSGMPDLWRCQILLDQDKAGDAVKACDAALGKGGLKDQGNAHYLHGVALFEVGKTAEARAALNKALAFPESKRNAESMLSNLR